MKKSLFRWALKTVVKNMAASDEIRKEQGDHVHLSIEDAADHLLCFEFDIEPPKALRECRGVLDYDRYRDRHMLDVEVEHLDSFIQGVKSLNMQSHIRKIG